MIHKVLLSILIVLGISVNAQSYRTGYLLTNQNDTIDGLIKYTGGIKSSQKCIFKPSEDAEVVEYGPNDIYGYRLHEGKFFVTKNIDSTFVFVEYLIWGEANIYFFSDKIGSHYFIETKKAGLVELSEPNRIIQTDEGTFELPSLHNGKLISTLNDFDEINSRAQNTDLTHRSLIKLAKDYHDFICDSVECIIFESTIKPTRFSFGLYSGLAFNYLNFGNKIESNLQPGIELGGFMEINKLFASNERFWFRIDIALEYQKCFSFKKYEMDSESKIIAYDGIRYYLNSTTNIKYSDDHYMVTSLDADLELLYLKIPITINYSYLLGDIGAYFGGGLNTAFILSQNKNFQYCDFMNRYGGNLPGFILGFRLHTGITFKTINTQKLSTEIYFDKSINLTNLNSIERFSSLTIGLKVGYVF